MASHEGWIQKAKSDLHLAEKGVKDDDLTLDTAIYHTQQCAEKALKGLNPFATEFRYPLDDETTIERDVVLDAIRRAQKILSFVEEKMSEQTRV